MFVLFILSEFTKAIVYLLMALMYLILNPLALHMESTGYELLTFTYGPTV